MIGYLASTTGHLGVSYDRVCPTSLEEKMVAHRRQMFAKLRAEMIANRDFIRTIDSKLIGTLATKLYALQSLSWDYCETVLDMCIQQKRGDTKKYVRKIREQKREFDIFHSRMSKEYRDNEAEQGYRFEDLHRADFQKMLNLIDHELGKLKYKGEEKQMMRAVFQADVLICATMKYGLFVDEELKKAGAKGLMKHSLIPLPFLQMADTFAVMADALGAPGMKYGVLLTLTDIMVNKLKLMEVNLINETDDEQ